MMKIDKSTHMLILAAFVLIFVIIYLYMAITDIKKLKTEVQGLQKDMTTLLDSAKCILPQSKQTAQTAGAQTQCEFLPLPVLTPVPSIRENVDNDDENEEEEESIDADEIKMMINDDEDYEEEEEAEVEEEVEEVEENDAEVEEEVEEIAADVVETVQTVPETPTIESLRKMKYEEIKELCRKKGISIKGTKEQLIEKISV